MLNSSHVDLSCMLNECTQVFHLCVGPVLLRMALSVDTIIPSSSVNCKLYYTLMHKQTGSDCDSTAHPDAPSGSETLDYFLTNTPPQKKYSGCLKKVSAIEHLQ